MAERTITEQIFREDPALELRKYALMEAAKTLTETPVKIPAYQVAELTSDQLESQKLARAGLGSFAPYIGAGGQSIEAGQQLGQTAAGYLTGADTRGQFLPAQQALQAGVGAASGIGQLAGQAGIGLGAMSAGTGQVGMAGQLAGQFLGANLTPSQAMLQQAAQASGSGTFGYNPAAAQAFMNPYQQAVTQQALGEMRRQADIAKTGAAAQAVRSGAFGGTREGVQRAETERGVQDIMSQRVMQDFAQNYAQAQQAAQQSFEAQQQRQMAGAGQLAGIGGTLGQQQLSQAQLGQAGTGLIGQLGVQQAQLGLLPSQLSSAQANILAQQAGLFGQLGQGIGSLAGQQFGIGQNISSGLGALGSQAGQLGVQQAALGEALQRGQLQDIQTMSTLGQQQQAQQQAEFEAQRQTQLQAQYEPYQRLGFLSDIYKGAPTTQSVLASQTAPSASPLAQVVGAAGSVITGAAAAKKIGLL
jgi:hypothetical protein